MQESIVTAPEPTITQLLTALMTARTELAKVKTNLAAKLADPEIVSLTEQKGYIAAIVDTYEGKIKAQVVAQFNVHKDKKQVPPGTAIRDKVTVTVTDKEALGKWVRETETGSKFLVVDVDGVVKYAQKIADSPAALPFVKVVKAPEATISADLSKFVVVPTPSVEIPEEPLPF
jgi:hypothetical protein